MTLLKYVAIIVALLPSALFAEGQWGTDFEEAKRKATEQSKDILVEFTGSDWCVPCKKLEKEILHHPDFNGAEHFILLSLDYPMGDSDLSEETKQQNDTLRRLYSVNEFPTILLMGVDGKPYAKTGYRPNGVEEFNEHLLGLMGQKAARDKAFARVDSSEVKEEQAEAIVAGFTAMPGVSPYLYPERLKQLRTLQPKSAFLKQLVVAKGPKGKLTFEELQDKVAEGSLEGEELQSALKGIYYGSQYETLESELEHLDKIVAVDPETRIGSMVDRWAVGMREYSKAKESPADGWLGDFEAAKERAANENKDLLVLFSSLGESACQKMQADIFPRPEAANEKFLLVTLNYPVGKYSRSDELKSHNAMLENAKAECGVKTTPVIMLMDSAAQPYAQILAYAPPIEDAKSFHERVLELERQKEARDQAFAAADSANDDQAKADKLVEAFEAMPNIQPFLYPERLEQLRAIEPDAWLFSSRAIKRGQISRAARYAKIQVLRNKIKAEEQSGADLQVSLGVIHVLTRYKTPAEQMDRLKEIIAIAPDSKHAPIFQSLLDSKRAELGLETAPQK